MPPGTDRAISTLTPARAWTVAVVATLVMAVSYVDRQTFAALSPTVCKDLHIGEAAYGVLTASFSVAYLIGAPLAGWLVDRIGARSGLVVAVITWSAVSAGHALVPTFAVLLLLRVALGTAEAPSFPGAAQAVRRSLPAGHRSAGFGLLFTGSSLGAMVAAPLAIAWSARYGWRVAFFGTAAVGLAWVPAWLLATRSPSVRATLTAGRADLPPSKTSPLSLIPDPAVLRALVLVVACAPAINFVYNWLPKYLVADRGLTQNALGPYLAVPPLFFDLGAIGFGVLASLRGRGRTGVPTDLVLASGALCAAVAVMPVAHDPWVTVGLAATAMVGGGGLYALLTSDMLARVDVSRVSSAGGLTASAQSLAYIAANLMTGVVLARTHHYPPILVVLGLLVLPGTAAWVLWPVDDRRR